jgi:hypothetical protein
VCANGYAPLPGYSCYKCGSAATVTFVVVAVLIVVAVLGACVLAAARSVSEDGAASRGGIVARSHGVVSVEAAAMAGTVS